MTIDRFDFEVGLGGQGMVGVDARSEPSGDGRTIVGRAEVFVFHAAVAGKGALGSDPADGEFDVAFVVSCSMMGSAAIEDCHRVTMGAGVEQTAPK